MEFVARQGVSIRKLAVFVLGELIDCRLKALKGTAVYCRPEFIVVVGVVILVKSPEDEVASMMLSHLG